MSAFAAIVVAVVVLYSGGCCCFNTGSWNGEASILRLRMMGRCGLRLPCALAGQQR